MKVCFIVNPRARNGRSRGRLRELSAHLERLGLRHETRMCESLDHARTLSQEANQSGRELIVAVGGDGTINRVLNGFFDGAGGRISPARMGVVYTGTSPDFCRSYGIPTAMLPALEALVSGVVRKVPVGRIEYAGAAGAMGPLRTGCFGCCANVGLGASLARLANGGIRRLLGDFLGTFVSLLRVLRHYRPGTLRVTLDGKPRTVTRVHNLSIGRTSHIASGIKVRHDLGERDARFYVLCVKNLSLAKLGSVLRRLYAGRPIVTDDCLSLEYARNISVSPVEGAVEVEFDGDPAGQCPCTVEAAADPLDLVVEQIL